MTRILIPFAAGIAAATWPRVALIVAGGVALVAVVGLAALLTWAQLASMRVGRGW